MARVIARFPTVLKPALFYVQRQQRGGELCFGIFSLACSMQRLRNSAKRALNQRGPGLDPRADEPPAARRLLPDRRISPLPNGFTSAVYGAGLYLERRRAHRRDDF